MKLSGYTLCILLALQPLAYASTELVDVTNSTVLEENSTQQVLDQDIKDIPSDNNDHKSQHNSANNDLKNYLKKYNGLYIGFSALGKNIVHSLNAKINQIIFEARYTAKYPLTYAGQQNIVSALRTLELVTILKFLYQIFSKVDPLQTPVTDSFLISSINSVCKKLNFTPTSMHISQHLGMNAVALFNGSIIIGQELLSKCSPQELKFVLGHEIAHITKNHIIQKIVGVLLIEYMLSRGIHEFFSYLQEILNVDEQSKMGKIITIGKKVETFIRFNPLVTYILLKMGIAYQSRLLEKEADIVSATTLNSAQDGIDFFERIKNTSSSSTSSSVLKWLNPLYLVQRINHLPWFSSHPSDDTRIAYLKALEPT